jgi:energy-coupling factor transport system substrate-specific component
MRELVSMWSHTRMVVLTAFCGAAYAAVLATFNAIQIIPAIHSLRPANALPVVFSLLFGPAGAWGAAIGNTLGDFFGILGPGTLFGAVGNFLYGLIPYKLWRRFGSVGPEIHGRRAFLRLGYVTLAAGIACALTVAGAVHALALAPIPFDVLFGMIILQSVGFTWILGPLLLNAMAPRARRWGLLYQDLVPASDFERAPRALRRLAVLLLWAALLGGTALALCMGHGWGMPVVEAKAFGAALAPVILVVVLAALCL